VSSGDDAWARNARALAPAAKLACLAHRPPDGHAVPIVEWHARQLIAMGWDVHLTLPARRINRDGPVVVHPGSGGPRKCWPPERFTSLFEHLQNIGRELIIVLGEVERERPPEGTTDWGRRFDVRQPTDLIELSEIISRAAVFVGNDSGPTHLAAQLGVGTVALFGPTDPRIWSPVGPAVTVLWPGAPAEMGWLGVEEVAAAVARY